MPLIIANALLISTPLDAIAETCEADNSAFNMPLLLFVALIGATVGGMHFIFVYILASSPVPGLLCVLLKKYGRSYEFST